MKTTFVASASSQEAIHWAGVLQGAGYRTMQETMSGGVINRLVEEKADLLIIVETSPMMGPRSSDLIRDIRGESGLEDLKIVLLAVEKDVSQFPDAGATGADVELTKPVSEEALLEKVKELLG